jgi:RNA polymerase sigma-70 factor (ECF subfamily)
MALNPAKQTDEDLVKHYQATKDKIAIGELFKRHSLMCYAVCNKYLKDEDASQDAAMQVFEKLFTDLLKHEIQNFRSWLHTVCRNHCLMQLRKPNLTLRMSDTEGENDAQFMELEGFLHHEENTTEKEFKLQTLEHAIEELKDKQKECIHLFYIEQKSYDEVSKITGYSINEVKSYIQNGKRNLKIILSNKGITLWLAASTWILHFA